MKTLHFTVSGQRLRKANQNGEFSGLQRGWKKYLTCSFQLDSDWDGMAIVAEFTNTDGSVYADWPVLVIDGICEVPDAMSDAHVWQVRLVGLNRNGSRIATNKVGIQQR